MAKAKKCRLILHGKYKELDGGTFPSRAAAKRYVKDFWQGPYTIENL